jgi:nicotinamidase-related amidase
VGAGYSVPTIILSAGISRSKEDRHVQGGALRPQHETALIVVDMQNDFVAAGAPMETPAGRAIVPFLGEGRRPLVVGWYDVHRPPFEPDHSRLLRRNQATLLTTYLVKRIPTVGTTGAR